MPVDLKSILLHTLEASSNFKRISNPTEDISSDHTSVSFYVEGGTEDFDRILPELAKGFLDKYAQQPKPNKCVNLASVRPGTGVVCFHGMIDDLQVRVVCCNINEYSFRVSIDTGLTF